MKELSEMGGLVYPVRHSVSSTSLAKVVDI